MASSSNLTAQVDFDSSRKDSSASRQESDFLALRWRELLGGEFTLPYIESLRTFLREEYRSGAHVFPPKNQIFRAFSELDLDDVKIVILGQDPYHGPGQAMGRSFAVPSGVPVPPSLRNIFQEVSADIGPLQNKNSALEGWVKQGVLLLNTVLTVRSGEAFSHRNKGWETFTDKVITQLGAREKPLCFLLWGSPAQSKAKLITNPKHLILRSVHPSPLSAHRGFLGCKHFSQANTFLVSQGQEPIDWQHS
jgi:uracil-DNA glycosylase